MEVNGRIPWDSVLKCAKESDNLYGKYKDIILRIGIFSKNALDVGKMKAVGRTVTFYLTTLLKDGFYVMMELAEINIPGSIDDLPKYFMDFNQKSSVLDIYDIWCNPLTPDETKKQHQRSRPTLSTPSFSRTRH
ncbi:unnamed protein product [Absidia cylindrospora]